jgi:hypothetical protein
MHRRRFGLVIGVLLAMAGTAAAVTPTCQDPAVTGLCGGGRTAAMGTNDPVTNNCVGAPSDCQLQRFFPSY